MLQSLRDEFSRLTAIVSIAHQEQRSGEPEQRVSGAAVEDLRRSLETLAGEEPALARAIRRPVSIERLGRYTLGNLVIPSVAGALGDYARASTWLGEQLGISGAVITATVQPVRLEVEGTAGAPRARSSGRSPRGPSRLRFLGEHVKAPEAAIDAIRHAGSVLLAPGSLYRSVLATAAVPDLACALRSTRARVLWISNLDPGSRETARMSPIDHLRVLRLHRIRVDAVVYDPSASLAFEPAQLNRYGVEPVPRELCSSDDPARHDPERLRLALAELIDSQATSPAVS
ncbi:MAG: YvcK family protein [Solirubrobacterales bacterium]|nr:YvcK family protein [Solirubrobacterales bacterium]